MSRGNIPRTEMRQRRGWMGSLGKARSALATATRNLADMTESDIPEVDEAVGRALDLIEEADEALTDGLSFAGRGVDLEYDPSAAERIE